MGLWDYVILGIVLAAIIVALIFVLKGKSKCSCGCDACPVCDLCKKKKNK